jgi:G3E family GTPase
MQTIIGLFCMDKIPIIILTGFLGAGKTTMLNRWLKTPAFADSAVLTNEFGEISLDHHLVETVAQGTVVLDSGCVCCTVRGALSAALRTLFWQRQDKKIPHFRRVIIETTGLADPAPIIHQLMAHPTILHHYRLAGIVTCVDSMFGAEQLDCHPEALKQAAVADQLLLTKADLSSATQLAALRSRLQVLNPGAGMYLINNAAPDFPAILDTVAYNPLGKQLDVQQWLKAETYRQVRVAPGLRLSGKAAPMVQNVNRHGEDIHAFCLRFEQPLPWDGLMTALEMLAALRGEQLLRVKGIINAEGHAQPRVIHGVQHMFFAPVTLERWPDEQRDSKLVFIVRELGSEFIVQTLNHFIAATRNQCQ